MGVGFDSWFRPTTQTTLEEYLQTSGQLDLAIAYLRGAGYGVVLIMKWAMDVEGYSLTEAKRLVALSPVWKDQDANFENFHDMCEEAFGSDIEE